MDRPLASRSQETSIGPRAKNRYAYRKIVPIRFMPILFFTSDALVPKPSEGTNSNGVANTMGPGFQLPWSLGGTVIKKKTGVGRRFCPPGQILTAVFVCNGSCPY